MNKDKIKKNIRWNAIKSSFVCILLGLACIFMMVCLFLGTELIRGHYVWWQILLLLFFVAIFGIAVYASVDYVRLFFDPLRSDLFLKYGSIENVETILAEIESTKLAEYDYYVLAENYAYNKKNVESILAYEDVLGLHKHVHKTNFVIDYYQVVASDKYGKTHEYTFSQDDEAGCEQFLVLMSQRCKKAMLGYTRQQQDYIARNRVKLQERRK